MGSLNHVLLILLLALPAGAVKGQKYDVYKHGKVVHTEQAIWFNTRADWERFVYTNLRDKGLTKEGALLGLAHARIAGGHWLAPKRTRGPLKGFNLWGIRATKEWKKKGKRYHYHGGLDWRTYGSPSHGVGGWLYVMRNYPGAKDELYDPSPSVQAYVVGLCFGKDGRRYMKCKGAKSGSLDLTYKKYWTDRLKGTMDMARKGLKKQGFSI